MYNNLHCKIMVCWSIKRSKALWKSLDDIVIIMVKVVMDVSQGCVKFETDFNKIELLSILLARIDRIEVSK